MIPDRIRALLEERQTARADKDFARADAIRDEVDAAGFIIRDTPAGPVAEPKPSFTRTDPAAIPDVLAEPATLVASVHLLYEGFPDDLARFLDAFERYHADAGTEVVIVDNASSDGDLIEQLAADRARVLHLDRELGWAAARNAGLKTSAGGSVILADLSIEPTGDIITPLRDALADDSVPIAGPFGLVSEDMRSWRDAHGPDADAIEGYLFATRRDLLAGQLINERFRWYRNADIDLSFQVRARAGGAPARIVQVPVVRHTHRGWDALSEDERAHRSKRNHYVFFDRWKDRRDLLLVARG